MIGFGHRPTAITILDRATPVLDHWPVGPPLLMSRRTATRETPDQSVDAPARRVLPASLFTSTGLSTLGLDRREPRVDEGRSGNGHPVAPFWLYSRVAHHAEHVLERRQPIRRGWSPISRVRLLAAPFCRPPVLGRPFGLGTYLFRF